MMKPRILDSIYGTSLVIADEVRGVCIPNDVWLDAGVIGNIEANFLQVIIIVCTT